jgi:hypothetical protein
VEGEEGMLTSSLYNKLISFCMLTNFVHPFFSATSCNIANCQVLILLAPIYLTFPI